MRRRIVRCARPVSRLPRSESLPDLRGSLDALYHDYNREDSASDPVHLVRPFADAADREIAGFCAASLAFGRVASVLNSIRTLFAAMGGRPAEFVRHFEPGDASPALHAMVHRWIRGRDVIALLWVLRQMLDRAGSLERFFAEGYADDDPDVSRALDSFSQRALALDLRRAYGRVPRRAGVCYFFPRPSAGSACKRLNLFLRWMIRRDEVDLGVWNSIPASKLVVPLDTHVIRLGRCLRLTKYASPGWKMAADITASLRRLDPVDPVRFDFSLCHVGMMNACGYGRKQGDTQCPLRGLCRPRVRASVRR
ncbi:MAG TPA: TIGR02757 family protein [Vicinamibacterales bacterium]|nr:TIGR02757 family protein [Vicinamibacterales bacterium]